MPNQPNEHFGAPGASALLKAQRLREQRQALDANRTRLGRFAGCQPHFYRGDWYWIRRVLEMLRDVCGFVGGLSFSPATKQPWISPQYATS